MTKRAWCHKHKKDKTKKVQPLSLRSFTDQGLYCIELLFGYLLVLLNLKEESFKSTIAEMRSRTKASVLGRLFGIEIGGK